MKQYIKQQNISRVLGRDSKVRQHSSNSEFSQTHKKHNPLQMKPRDIDKKYNITVVDGKIMNKGATRNDTTVAYPINLLKTKNMVNFNTKSFIGGHLFKCEYGGEDNYQNVVPWGENIEKKYSDDFEEKYEKEIVKKDDTYIFSSTAKFEDYIVQTQLKNKAVLEIIKLGIETLPNMVECEVYNSNSTSNFSPIKWSLNPRTKFAEGEFEENKTGIDLAAEYWDINIKNPQFKTLAKKLDETGTKTLISKQIQMLTRLAVLEKKKKEAENIIDILVGNAKKRNAKINARKTGEKETRYYDINREISSIRTKLIEYDALK